METADIEKRFTYHPPHGDQEERYVEVRKCVTELAHALNALCPESREKSLAITNLEQAQFWANASIAREDDATPK